jgi:hypothetical protein
MKMKLIYKEVSNFVGDFSPPAGGYFTHSHPSQWVSIYQADMTSFSEDV